MDLQNQLLHMRGKAIKVNGNTYELDDQGVARGVASEDAARLLKNKDAWKRYVERTPPVPPKADLTKTAKPPAPKPVEQPPPPPPPPVGDPPGDPGMEEAGGEEWPDPTEEMELDFLREMAKAYDVKFAPRTGKKRLVADIMAAMYPPE